MAEKKRNTPQDHKKILILGGSGFIGRAIYKELRNFYPTYATYCHSSRSYGDNGNFVHYDIEEDDIVYLLERVRPRIVISAIRGNFAAQIQAHQHLVEYAQSHDCRIYFLSSANVFDGYRQFPSYEYDKTLSESIYGRLKIKIENMLLRLPESKMAILRLPMVFGNTSPRIKEITSAIWSNEPVEIFPNLVMNVTNDNKISQQILYLINRDKGGIYHLGSRDLVHHDDFIQEVVERIGDFSPIYKRVYTTNEERYLAALPKNNLLPVNLQVSYQEVIDQHVLR